MQKFGVVRHACLCLMRGQEVMHAGGTVMLTGMGDTSGCQGQCFGSGFIKSGSSILG
jgi:hypothetical protein